MLDNSLLLYGSNMSNSNAHNQYPLPTAVIGRAGGKVRGNQHIDFAQRTPLANVLLTMLERSGVPVEKVGDSTGLVTAVVSARVRWSRRPRGVAGRAGSASAAAPELVGAARAGQSARALELLAGRSNAARRQPMTAPPRCTGPRTTRMFRWCARC